MAAIIGILALAASAFYRPAGFVAGVTGVDAGGRTAARITMPDGVFGEVSTATANPGGDAWVRVVCYQAGQRVMEGWEKVDSANQASFQMGPTPSWSGGAASCLAEEGYWFKGYRWRVLAETTFDVAP